MSRLASLGAVSLVLGLLVACDDTTFLVGSGGGGGGGQGWCGVTSLIDAHCTGCHSAAASLGGLDLQTDPYNALVGAASTYPGRTLVVPGDPAGSFLMVKLTGTQTASEGSKMPVSGALSPSEVDLVSAWIADGASSVCTGTDTAVATCNDRNETCGRGSCGAEGSPSMLPGADCLACHGNKPVSEAPHFTAAGTAFVDLAGSAPLVGAKVLITDADGVEIADPHLTTNGAGNFYTTKAIRFPMQAAIDHGGNVVSMQATQGVGGCDSCHQCGGAAGGKLYGP